MEYADKTLTCSDCGMSFTFSASEQEFFANKGFENEPKRCPDCRAAKKSQRSGGYRGDYGPRQMYRAVCASCHKDCEVPFMPRHDRPVYCSDCYSSTKR
jgi:CxxC-x17-CxxC domain-containing protein